MSIDVAQFHQVFFEESFEGLDVMEGGLLQLNSDADPEQINSIFRAAHSIKGGAGTFGFNSIASFTHVLETLLDEVRNGQRDIADSLTQVLLQSVDVLRAMLSAAKRGEQYDAASNEAALARLQQFLDDSDAQTTTTNQRWQISLQPYPDLMHAGNDPVQIFRELDNKSTSFSVTANDSAVPDFVELEPENLYLSWQLQIDGELTRADLEEVFEGIIDRCDLVIENVSVPTEEQTNVDVTTPILPEVTEPVRFESTDNPETGYEFQTNATAVSIPVATNKIDALINMVGELVITQSMLSQIGEDFVEDRRPQLNDRLAELERNTRQLQEGILGIRMLPISFAFHRFPGLVQDLCAKTGKQVELKMTGEHTELDRGVMEKISGSLIHLVRNSLAHGFELPEVRRLSAKSETGLLQLHAYHQGGNIMIEIHDDGAGLNEQKILAKAVERGLVSADEKLSADKIHELVFLPGFSTAESVSDISGRGVGMDVVRKNIHSLGGRVDIHSQAGQGVTITIRLPNTPAITDGQSVKVAGDIFIIPVASVIESFEVVCNDVKKVAGKGELYLLRNEYIPVIWLHEIFNLAPRSSELEKSLMVVVEDDGQPVGLFVDDLLGQQQVVIKSLETNYRKVPGFSGATILGDGSVALIVDVSGLIKLYRGLESAAGLNDDGRAA